MRENAARKPKEGERGPAPALVASLPIRVRICCSYCMAELGERGAVHCAECLARYHADCFRELGACGVLGCGCLYVLQPKPVKPRRTVLRLALGSSVLALLLALGALAFLEYAAPAKEIAELSFELSECSRRHVLSLGWNERPSAAEVKAPAQVFLGRGLRPGTSLTYRSRSIHGRSDVTRSVVARDAETVTLHSNERLAEQSLDGPAFPGHIFELVVARSDGRVLSSVLREPSGRRVEVETAGEAIAPADLGAVRVSLAALGPRTLKRVAQGERVFDLIAEGPMAGLPLRMREPGGAWLEVDRPPREIVNRAESDESWRRGYLLTYTNGDTCFLSRHPVLVALLPFGPTGWGLIKRSTYLEEIKVLDIEVSR